jgi:polyisoprenoid-binding protein YceI
LSLVLLRAALTIVLLVLSGIPAVARQWAIDQDATFILVDVAYITGGQVSIRFADVGGTIRFDDRRPDATVAHIVVVAGTAASGLAPLDPVVRGASFLNAREHPTIEFDFERLKQSAPSEADISGVITVFGISAPFEMKAQVVRYRPNEPNPDDRVISFNLFGEINRTDFGNTTQTGVIKSVLPIRIHLALRPIS